MLNILLSVKKLQAASKRPAGFVAVNESPLICLEYAVDKTVFKIIIRKKTHSHTFFLFFFFSKHKKANMSC